MTDANQQTQDDLIRTLLNLPPSRKVFTKSQRAYAEVRKAIVTHSLPADTSLDETYLQSLFLVGRTPLREALKRLSHEGLLVWTSHQAPTVRDVGIHEMQYLYETRRMLEPTIAKLAARRATPADVETIQQYTQALIEAAKMNDVYRSVENDYALHSAIAGATQNGFLAQASNYLNLQSLRPWYRAHKALGVTAIGQTHRDLVATIVNRDEAGAEELAHLHINSSLDRQTSLLTLNPQEPEGRLADE